MADNFKNGITADTEDLRSIFDEFESRLHEVCANIRKTSDYLNSGDWWHKNLEFIRDDMDSLVGELTDFLDEV